MRKQIMNSFLILVNLNFYNLQCRIIFTNLLFEFDQIKKPLILGEWLIKIIMKTIIKKISR
jgi:hypothetical protein